MPVASVQQGIISFYVPSNTPASTNIPLEVRSGRVSIASITTSVQSEPRFAILTADGSGTGYAAALNQDGSLNANNPAAFGSIVSIFGIGGTPSRVMVGNIAAEIEYAGPAPGLLPGIKQVNFRIPDQAYFSNAGFVNLSTVPGSPNGWPVFLHVTAR